MSRRHVQSSQSKRCGPQHNTAQPSHGRPVQHSTARAVRSTNTVTEHQHCKHLMYQSDPPPAARTVRMRRQASNISAQAADSRAYPRERAHPSFCVMCIFPAASELRTWHVGLIGAVWVGWDVHAEQMDCDGPQAASSARPGLLAS